MDNMKKVMAYAWVAGLCLLGPVYPSHAEESLVLPDVLTPVALADLVVTRNADVAALRSVLAAAEANTEIAGSLDDPMLSYAIAPRTVGSDLNDRHLVSLSQALPWPGVRQLRTAVAQSERDVVGENMDELKLQVRAAAHAAYANWAYVHRALAFNAENRQLLRELVTVAATAYGAGRGAQQDVVGAQLREVELQQAALLLERQRVAVAAGIRALLATTATTKIPPPVMVRRDSALPAEAELVERALLNNPRLKAMRHQMHASGKRIELAQKAFYPNFKLNAAYVGTLDPREKRTQVGVAINLPLDRSKRRAEVDRRQAEQMAQQFRIDDMAAQITAQLVARYARWQQARDTLQLIQAQLLPLAQQNLSATRSDYSSGNGDFRAVIDAETSLLKTETILARSEADVAVAEAEIKQLTGQGLEVEP